MESLFCHIQIDAEAASGMSPEDLADYIPHRGDVLALSQFIKQRTSTISSPAKSNKTSLIERLRERLNSNDNNEGTFETRRRKQPKNAIKKTQSRAAVTKL